MNLLDARLLLPLSLPALARKAGALLLGISATLACAVGHAAADTHFVLAAYGTVAGGHDILHGNYHAALTALSARRYTDTADAAAVSLNRCAALTMAAQWPAARSACNKAVHYAHLVKLTHVEESLTGLHRQDEGIALAHSDRAVLESLTAQGKAAAQDMKQAWAFLPGSGLVAQNLTALSLHSAQVLVRSAEQR